MKKNLVLAAWSLFHHYSNCSFLKLCRSFSSHFISYVMNKNLSVRQRNIHFSIVHPCRLVCNPNVFPVSGISTVSGCFLLTLNILRSAPVDMIVVTAGKIKSSQSRKDSMFLAQEVMHSNTARLWAFSMIFHSLSLNSVYLNMSIEGVQHYWSSIKICLAIQLMCTEST